MPDGYRMIVTSTKQGGLLQRTVPLVGDAPTWQWQYTMDEGGNVKCEFERGVSLDLFADIHKEGVKISGNNGEDGVFDFTI